MVAYHGVMRNVRLLSNWAEPYHHYIFSEHVDQPDKELESLISVLQQQGRPEKAGSLLWVKVLKETDKSQKRLTLHDLKELALSISKTASLSAKFTAASILLHCATEFAELSIDNAASSCVAESTSLLDSMEGARWLANRTPAPSGSTEDLVEDVRRLALSSDCFNKQSFFPKQRLKLKLLRERHMGTSWDPIFMERMLELANEATQLGEQDIRRSLFLEAWIAARASHLRQPTRTSLQCLSKINSESLSFEMRERKTVWFYVADLLARTFSTKRLLPSSICYDRCSDFFANCQEFDVPILLSSMYSVASQAAARLGLPKSEISGL